MIGTRPWLTGASALVLTTFGFGAGAPRPEIAIEAERLVTERAEAAAGALAPLHDQLMVVIDAAREGSAAIVAGDAPPGPSLLEAADLLLAAVPAATVAERSVRDLERARRARSPDAAAMPPGAEGASFAGIAAQLADAAEAGDLFAEMRRRAASVPESLEEALSALAADDLVAAADSVAVARADHDALAGWDVDIVTLPIWIETTDATIGAVERLVAAIEADDAEAAERAAQDVAELSDDATRADRALQLAISEGGGSIAAPPLAQLAAAIGAVEAQRSAVGGIVAGVAR